MTGGIDAVGTPGGGVVTVVGGVGLLIGVSVEFGETLGDCVG
jgi:hypothetical protein